METGKPSKEQLDSYFRTSRKYFDSLAAQYMKNDREFYDKYFAPYYNNPFKTSRGQKGSSIIVVIVVVAFLGIAGAFVVYIGNSYKTDSDHRLEREEQAVSEHEKTSETISNSKSTAEKKVITSYDPDGKFDTLAVSYLKTDFEKGAYYYGRKNYEMSEEYFNKIEKNDKEYYAARDVLRRIQKDKDKEKENRSARKKPVEKIN